MTLKIREIKAMSKEELTAKLEELRKELVKNNAQIATGTTPKNPGQIKEIKKTIARILTVINQKKFDGKLKNNMEEKRKDE
ncbi:50S ribosomal protein L29 [Candidatus Woesearchaeota archaeon]|nr:50S ribosomal protein L29 [Candidatus Woesearchaeota archaeon]